MSTFKAVYDAFLVNVLTQHPLFLMESLDQKVIIYDDACPMCKAYTAGFVKAGWLQHRSGFSNADPDMIAKIDLDRARHEIPLLDLQTGKVVYGLDALFLIIGTKWPVFKPLFKATWFKKLLYPLYQIITYNRRVIAGSGAPVNGFDCAPDVNLFYRWLYIGLAVLGATFLYWPLWQHTDTIANALVLLQLITPVLVIWMRHKLDFMGHWATVALASGLVTALLPVPVLLKATAGLLLTGWMWWLRRDKF
jgi:predicted DCC family thiol-disulfide oxidoreductase YuxK